MKTEMNVKQWWKYSGKPNYCPVPAIIVHHKNYMAWSGIEAGQPPLKPRE